MQSLDRRLKLTTINLQETEAALAASQERVAAEISAHEETQMALDAAEWQIAGDEISHQEAKRELQSLRGTVIQQYQRIRTSTRHNERLQKDRTFQHQLVRELKGVLLPAAEDRARAAEEQLHAVTMESERFQISSQTNLDQAEEEATKISNLLEQCRRKVKALQIQVIRTKHLGDHKVLSTQEKMRRQSHTYKMMHSGSYTVGVRMLARAFTKSGCSQGLVGPMIRLVGSVIGVKMKGKLTRHTVSRCIREGGVAARLQLGSELAQVKSKISYLYCSDRNTYKCFQASLRAATGPLIGTSPMILATSHTRYLCGLAPRHCIPSCVLCLYQQH